MYDILASFYDTNAAYSSINRLTCMVLQKEKFSFVLSFLSKLIKNTLDTLCIHNIVWKVLFFLARISVGRPSVFTTFNLTVSVNL